MIYSQNFSNLEMDQKLVLISKSKQDVISQLSKMIQIRLVEHRIADMRKLGHIGGPVHLGAGQEAIAVGISKYLQKSDKVFV